MEKEHMEDIVDLLIERRAPLDQRDNAGFTVLHWSTLIRPFEDGILEALIAPAFMRRAVAVGYRW